MCNRVNVSLGTRPVHFSPESFHPATLPIAFLPRVMEASGVIDMNEVVPGQPPIQLTFPRPGCGS